jgi:hypothetical protein
MKTKVATLLVGPCRRLPLRVSRSAFAAALRVSAFAACVIGSGGHVRAQDGATSPMGQGQASINVRSDVTLGIKGERSTPTARLEQLTEVASDQMPSLRKCYRDLVAKRPTSVGSIAIRVTMEQGKAPPLFELKENGGTEPDLTGCVKRVLEHAPWAKVTRPAAAVLTLEFQNSRAKGEHEMQQRIEAADRFDVREQDGGFAADWSSSDGKVSFGASSASREAVEASLRALRDAFAGFADCRRRSEKGGLSPAGVLEVQLQLQHGGKASAKVMSSTVAHERAVPCTERAFKGLHFDNAPAGQRVQVHVTFGGAAG